MIDERLPTLYRCIINFDNKHNYDLFMVYKSHSFIKCLKYKQGRFFLESGFIWTELKLFELLRSFWEKQIKMKSLLSGQSRLGTERCGLSANSTLATKPEPLLIASYCGLCNSFIKSSESSGNFITPWLFYKTKLSCPCNDDVMNC